MKKIYYASLIVLIGLCAVAGALYFLQYPKEVGSPEIAEQPIREQRLPTTTSTQAQLPTSTPTKMVSPSSIAASGATGTASHVASSTSSISNNEVKNQGSSISEWETYKNTQYGFAFKYDPAFAVGPDTEPSSLPKNDICRSLLSLGVPVFAMQLFAIREFQSAAPTDLGPDVADICLYSIPTDTNVDTQFDNVYGEDIKKVPSRNAKELAQTLTTAKPNSVISYEKKSKGDMTITTVFLAGEERNISPLITISYITDTRSSYVYQLTFSPQYFNYKTDPMIPSDEEYLNTWQKIVESFQVL